MIDPFSITGAVGLAAGLLGFIVSTVERSNAALKTTKQGIVVLKAHHRNLRSQEIRVIIWQRKWCPERFNRRLEYLWGSQGLQEIGENGDCIMSVMGTLQNLLYSSTGSENRRRTSDEREQGIWRMVLDNRGNDVNQAPYDAATINIFHRVAMGLWKDNLLNVNIERLKNLIDCIEYQANAFYWNARGRLKENKDVQPEDIKQAVRVQERAERLCQAMGDEYERVSIDGTWALLLPMVNDPKQLQLDVRDELRLSFFSLTRPEADRRGKRICLDFHLDLDNSIDLSGCLSKDNQLSDNSDDGTLDTDVKSMLWSLARRPRQHHPEIYKSTTETRARLALVVATWTTLAWGTRWTDKLCTCGIRLVHFGGRGPSVPAVWQKATHEHCGWAQSSNEGQNLRLALVLAELALAQPIDVQIGPEMHMFNVHDSDITATSVDSQILLDQVYRSTSRYFRDALQDCLRGGPDPSQVGDIVMQYTDRVIRPLCIHYERVLEDLDRQATIYSSIEEPSLPI